MLYASLRRLLCVLTLVTATSVPAATVFADDAATAEVTGRVVDESGVPVGGAVVECQASPRNVTATTDAEGRFAAETQSKCDQIVARASDGSLVGYLRTGELDATLDLEVVVIPPRTIDVAVEY